MTLLISIKVFSVLAFFGSKSVQSEPLLTCGQEPLSGMIFSSYPYNRATRSKCVFSNINSIDDIKNVISEQSFNKQSITSMAFNESNLSEFPDRMFATFMNLRSLDGRNLNLIAISSNAFSGLSSLDTINLSFNNLTSLPTKVFANRKLKYLDLSYNLISSIDESAFMGSEIDKINLSFNKIKSTTFINGFKYFALMQMNDNMVANFDKVDIDIINWVGQRELFFTPQFPSINLQNNKLKVFDCSSTVKFVLFDLENNRDLKEVKINNCEIAQLDVTDCLQLKNVELNDNLSGFTAKNVNFDKIDFSKSHLLISLTLVNNSLSTQALGDIMKLENLTSLDLSHNTIGSLNVSTFAKLKQLTTLTLKSTYISDIKFGTFSHQTGVRMLDISDNGLGFFDMQMIFSMNSLTYLDISGNNLTELKNIESAHTTFTALEKIDLSNNKWTCKYLMRLMRVMQAYRVAMMHSLVEEHQSNIHGIFCVHVEGEDTNIAPLMPDSSNITEIREKMNELVNEIGKMASSRTEFEVRLKSLESRMDNRASLFSSTEALRSTKIENIEVKNSVFLELALIVVCCCATIFIVLKTYVYVQTNIRHRPRNLRAGMSENTLAMNVDYDF